MRGYGIHLLFHGLAILTGAGAGVAAGLWWRQQNPQALSLGVAALVLGILVLVIESLTARSQRRSQERRARAAELAGDHPQPAAPRERATGSVPAAAGRGSGTRNLPPMEPDAGRPFTGGPNPRSPTAGPQHQMVNQPPAAGANHPATRVERGSNTRISGDAEPPTRNA